MGSHRAHPRAQRRSPRALAEVVEAGPVPAVDGGALAAQGPGAVALGDVRHLARRDHGRARVEGARLRQSARPRHYAQNELAVEAFKKNFPAELAKIRARLPKGVEIELWWQDEARIGQKNKLTRRWARRGTRPRAPRDQRTEWAYIFGAICPAKGKGAGLVMPLRHRRKWRRTSSSSAAVDPGAHAVLIVDQAGWHLTPKLAIPDNITVLALPPRSPELNPVENVWQFIATTGCRTGSSNPTKTSSRCAAKPGTTSSTNHGRSVPRHAQMGAWVLINDRWYNRL